MVIVGRGGFSVLAGLADVLNVRIQAPRSLRIMRLVDIASVGDPGLAEELVRKNDHLQQAFIKSVYGTEWNAADGFDLVIDTGKVTPDVAVDLLVQAVEALPAARSGAVRTTADLPSDKVLIATVDEILNRVFAPVG